MATLAGPTIPRKAFYATFYDEPGAVCKVAGALYFVTDVDVIEVTLDTLNHLVILGQMQMSDAQHIADLMDGGPAGIACSRNEGRQ
jgi:hypothetical protein